MEKVYEEFSSYDFESSPSYKNTLEQVYNQYLIVMSDKDMEVKQDLSNGVFNPNRIPQADREQLQLQTKIFVFCSETGNILELQDYQFWLANKEGAEQVSAAGGGEISSGNENAVNLDVEMVDASVNVDASADAGTPTSNSQPGTLAVDTANGDNEEYTSNYQEIVDMIVNNKPIPGIKQIPKTILDPNTASKSTLQQRKKPWETQEEAASSETSVETPLEPADGKLDEEAAA